MEEHGERKLGRAHQQDVDAGEVVHGEVVSESGRVPLDRVQITESFSGPLPPPQTLREYNEVVPGLAQEIVDQWKGETTHRHDTIDALRETDKQALRAFYKGEMVGQLIAAVLFLAILAVVVYAIYEHNTAVGIAGIVAAGASVIWAIRRRSGGGEPGLPPARDVGNPKGLEEPGNP